MDELQVGHDGPAAAAGVNLDASLLKRMDGYAMSGSNDTLGNHCAIQDEGSVAAGIVPSWAAQEQGAVRRAKST
ncbi:MAG TPA: hypothetical protein VFR59_09235 [Steroidobacteraceae bacterium]|nr:hypothetical protein [Steroidobacteraceae bacterium]